MRRWNALAALVVVLCGCGGSPHEGFKLLEDDVHYQLRVIGEGEDLPRDEDSLRLHLRMGRSGEGVGSLLSMERDYATKDLRQGTFIPLLRRLHEGDSVSVIAPAGSWPWTILAPAGYVPPDTGMVHAEIAVLRILTPAAARAGRERLRREEPLVFEQRLLGAFLDRSDVRFVRWGEGGVHHHITGAPVDTNAIDPGDQVTISYRGRRLEDGIVFDDTRSNGLGLTFNWGDRDQVIPGMDVALSLLREGQEGRFIFTSAYAFGARGIPGVLDPYMPVEYTVRLERVVRSRDLAR